MTPPSDRHLLEAALGPAANDLGGLYANVLLGSVVHDLAVVRTLVDDPSAIDHADAWDGVPGSVAFEGRIGERTRLSMRWHFLEGHAAYRESVALHLEDASVEVVFASPFQLHTPTLLTVTEPDDGSERSGRWLSPTDAFEHQLQSWHRAVTASAPVAVTAAEGRTDIETCQRIAALLASDRGIDLGGEAAGSWNR